MALTNHAWLWNTNDKSTLYVQVADGTLDNDQVVFKWTGICESPTAHLRSSGDVLTDCFVLDLNQNGCHVQIGDYDIHFIWQEPTRSKPGLILEGVTFEQKATTWAQRHQSW